MSKKVLGIAVAVAALAFAPSAAAQTPKEGSGKLPSGGMSEAVMITATVQAVDLTARTVTLKGPKGKVETVKVDASIKNLDRLKVGDEVVAKYYEALAWDV